MASATETYNGVLLHIGEGEGVEVVDAATMIPSSLSFLRDDVHRTDRRAAGLEKKVAGVVLGAMP